MGRQQDEVSYWSTLLPPGTAPGSSPSAWSTWWSLDRSRNFHSQREDQSNGLIKEGGIISRDVRMLQLTLLLLYRLVVQGQLPRVEMKAGLSDLFTKLVLY